MKKKVHHKKHQTAPAPRVYNVGPYSSYWGPSFGLGSNGGGHPGPGSGGHGGNEGGEGAEGSGDSGGSGGSGGTGGGTGGP